MILFTLFIHSASFVFPETGKLVLNCHNPNEWRGKPQGGEWGFWSWQEGACTRFNPLGWPAASPKTWGPLKCAPHAGCWRIGQASGYNCCFAGSGSEAPGGRWGCRPSKEQGSPLGPGSCLLEEAGENVFYTQEVS